MALIQRIIHALLVVQPPHPIFVHFPIALISAAFFFLLIAIWRKSEIFEKIAFANIALASVSIIVTEFFGIRDNIVFYKSGAPNHIAKIVIASTLLVLTGIIAIVRWRNPRVFYGGNRAVYIAGYVVSFLLVAVQGFLGGIIVYGF